MNKLRVSTGGASPAQGRRAQAGAARVAARTAAPRDLPPDLDTGVLFVGDGAAQPAPSTGPDSLAPFTRLVGVRIGPANGAWGSDALGLLRSLQKRLIEHALGLPAAARRPCLDAVAVLEPAVGMRLRIMQMQLSQLEDGTGRPQSHHFLKEAGHGASL